MTREEAISIMNVIVHMLEPQYDNDRVEEAVDMAIKALEQEQKSGKCKDCKYFEYDSVAKVDGVPLIVAHEICNKWGDSCKTNENGFCFMFEESEDKE